MSWTSISQPRFKLVDARIESAGLDTFGRLASAHLIIEAPFLQVIPSGHAHGLPAENFPMALTPFPYKAHSIYEWLRIDALDIWGHISAKTIMYCIAIWEDTRETENQISFCIVVKQNEDSTELYERIGTCTWQGLFGPTLKKFTLV
jgi:hypothetical protein